MNRYELTIPMRPVAKARPRSTIRYDKSGRPYIQTFTPTNTKEAEAVIALHWLEKYGQTWIEDELEVSVLFYMPNKQRGDLDNYIKTVSDALNNVAYKDDKQIIKLYSQFMGIDKDNPRIELILTALGVSV